MHISDRIVKIVAFGAIVFFIACFAINAYYIYLIECWEAYIIYPVYLMCILIMVLVCIWAYMEPKSESVN